MTFTAKHVWIALGLLFALGILLHDHGSGDDPEQTSSFSAPSGF
jgi:hypothetical protein